MSLFQKQKNLTMQINSDASLSLSAGYLRRYKVYGINMTSSDNILKLQKRLTVDSSVRRSGKYTVLITAILFVIIFISMLSSMEDPVGGSIIFVALPFWALIFLFLLWPFVWSSTEFWRIMRHRSMMKFWPIRFCFAIIFFFGPIFLGLLLWVTFLEP